jgi:hypothetical protein
MRDLALAITAFVAGGIVTALIVWRLIRWALESKD